ncbi:MAG: hypothetical protein ACLR1T_03630 [Evtepia gabavorous]
MMRHTAGFGAAPKFPMGHSLLFLLTYGEKKADPAALAMAEKTLEQLYRGGIYDHIGGGFCAVFHRPGLSHPPL